LKSLIVYTTGKAKSKTFPCSINSFGKVFSHYGYTMILKFTTLNLIIPWKTKTTGRFTCGL